MADKPFDTALDPQIDLFLQEIEKAGVPIFDKEGKKKWVKDKLSKGFSLKLIQEKLKEYNYDFTAASKYFDEITSSKEKAEQAVQEVAKMKEEQAAEKKRTKLSGRVGLILTAFILGGVGFFTWNMFKKSSGGAADDLNLMAGPAGGLMQSFTKGSLIVGIAGIAVGVLLTVFFVADHFIKKAKERKKGEPEKQDKAAAEEKAKAMEQEISVAEQASQQKLEPPKLVS